VITAIVNWLYRTGLKRGSSGGHWAWLIVALAAWILRQDRGRRAEPAVRMQIKPGERVLVTMRDLDTSAES